MFLSGIVPLVLLVVHSLEASPVEPLAPIIGGSNVEDKKVPYLVSITVNSFVCGGSIIADRWILTAAHCIKRYEKYSLQKKRIYGSIFLT